MLVSYDENELPFDTTTSMEVDLAYFDDPDESKADLINGAIGELSCFHQAFGFYAQASARAPQCSLMDGVIE